jgi:hypothetical protein
MKVGARVIHSTVAHENLEKPKEKERRERHGAYQRESHEVLRWH